MPPSRMLAANSFTSAASIERQHRFDFLRGTSGRHLPVDAYYEIDAQWKLVIEYREMQHSESL